MGFTTMSDAVKFNIDQAKMTVLPQVLPTPIIEMDDYVCDIERFLENYRADNLSEAVINEKILAEIQKISKPGNIEEVAACIRGVPH